MKVTQGMLNEEKVRADEEQRRNNIANWDKMQHGGNNCHKYYRLLKTAFDIQDRVNVEFYEGFMLIINNKFIISPKSKKWRINGKGKWYWYKDIDNFIERYVL